MTLHTYDDIEIGDSDEFGDYLVTKEEIIEFAQKYDPQPFHLDEDFAKKTHFGALCASGWMTCGIMMRLICENVFTNSSAVGSPGVENVNWHKPVFAGDRLSVRAKTVDKRLSKSKPYLGTVKVSVEVLNQHKDVVLTLQPTVLYLTREGAATLM